MAVSIKMNLSEGTAHVQSQLTMPKTSRRSCLRQVPEQSENPGVVFVSLLPLCKGRDPLQQSGAEPCRECEMESGRTGWQVGMGGSLS